MAMADRQTLAHASVRPNCLCCAATSCTCSSKLSDVLLQPVTDPSTGKCMAVLCALNKHERPAGRDIFYEQTFTPSDW
jgi:hypothetical protein